jgi:dihydroorotate dehydrogenase electron transfer subunit
MYDRHVAIESVTRVGPGQFVLAFESPEIAAGCRPGHFVMISVADSIDPLLRRPMAIYRVLRDDDGAARGFTMLVEVVGRGTALLEQKEPGDRVWLLGPLGVPFTLPAADEETGEHLLVMGGVGAAPFPLLAEELLARGYRVRAFVGARTAAALLCVGDFEELGVPVEVSTDDGTAGFEGFVVGPLERYLEANDESSGEANDVPEPVLYACGPTPMMRAVHDIAVARELPLQVSFEAPMACGIGVCLSCVVPIYDEAAEAGQGSDAGEADEGGEAGAGWSFVRCCREGPVFDSRRLVWR